MPDEKLKKWENFFLCIAFTRKCDWWGWESTSIILFASLIWCKLAVPLPYLTFKQFESQWYLALQQLHHPAKAAKTWNWNQIKNCRNFEKMLLVWSNKHWIWMAWLFNVCRVYLSKMLFKIHMLFLSSWFWVCLSLLDFSTTTYKLEDTETVVKVITRTKKQE